LEALRPEGRLGVRLLRGAAPALERIFGGSVNSAPVLSRAWGHAAVADALGAA
jgi:hypothetical protein